MPFHFFIRNVYGNPFRQLRKLLCQNPFGRVQNHGAAVPRGHPPQDQQVTERIKIGIVGDSAPPPASGAGEERRGTERGLKLGHDVRNREEVGRGGFHGSFYPAGEILSSRTRLAFPFRI